MEFFIDTANIEEIKQAYNLGLLDGVTTNPSLILKSGRNLTEVIKEICDLMPELPVSAEVVSEDYEAMIKEGDKLSQIADNVVIKLPVTMDGLRACRYFSNKNIDTNLTLCFSANQALLAAKAGATYISPFVGRLDDIATEGVEELIDSIRLIYDNYNYQTKILVASIRSPLHIKKSAEIGADVCTIPAKVIEQLVKHPLTDKGLEQFKQDWNATKQSL